MQTNNFLRDVLASLSPRRPVETPLDRALRDGGDDVDPEARRLATLDLVRRAARGEQGEARVSPGLVLLLVGLAVGSVPLFANRLSTLDPGSLPAIPPVLVLAWLGCAALCGMIASAKRRSVGGAIVAGLVFGLLAVGFFAIAPPKPERS